jgi:hypothetical protein
MYQVAGGGTMQAASDLQALQQVVRFVDVIVDQGRLQGKKIRQTDDDPPAVVCMDIVQGVRANYEAARKWVYRNIETVSMELVGTSESRRAASNDPPMQHVGTSAPGLPTSNNRSIEEVQAPVSLVARYIREGHFRKVQLPGKGQRPVWVCDGMGALWILGNLKGPKYQQLADDIQAMKDFITARVLGGSHSVQELSNAVAQRVDAMETDQPGSSGLLGALREEAKREDRARIERISYVRRCLDRNASCEANKAASRHVTRALPGVQKPFHVNKNIIVCRAATNATPQEVRDRLRAPKRVSARSLMGSTQLAMATLMERLTQKYSTTEKTPGAVLQRLSNAAHSMERVTDEIKDDFADSVVTPNDARRCIASATPQELQAAKEPAALLCD